MPDEQKQSPTPRLWPSVRGENCRCQPLAGMGHGVPICESCRSAQQAEFERAEKRKEWERQAINLLARHPSLPGVVTLSGEEVGKIKEALEAALPMIHRQFSHTRCAVTAAMEILTRAQKEG